MDNIGVNHNTPFFSIIIPVYNVEQYLEDCIQSVLNQNLQDFEIIIINDGSTDNSPRIAEKFAKSDSRIRLFHQSNHGQIATRERAIKYASGNYYLFLDSDDYWDKNLLYDVYNTIRNHGCDMVIYKWKRIFENNRTVVLKGVFDTDIVFDESNKKILYSKLLATSDLNSLWSKAIKSSIASDGRKDYSQYEHVRNAEDLLQSLEYFTRAKKIVYINKALYNYRQNPSSVTKKFSGSEFKSISFVRKELIEYCGRWGIMNLENTITFYKFYFININKLIKRSFFMGLSNLQKTKLLTEIIHEELIINACTYLCVNDLSLLYKLELFLIKRKNVGLLKVINTLFYNKLTKKLYVSLKTFQKVVK